MICLWCLWCSLHLRSGRCMWTTGSLTHISAVSKPGFWDDSADMGTGEYVQVCACELYTRSVAIRFYTGHRAHEVSNGRDTQRLPESYFGSFNHLSALMPTRFNTLPPSHEQPVSSSRLRGILQTDKLGVDMAIPHGVIAQEYWLLAALSSLI